jgi:hypothetical protein
MMQTPYSESDGVSRLPGSINIGVDLVTRALTGPAAKLFELKECDRKNIIL